MIYTLNDPEQVARFTDWGVDNIITDLPGALEAAQRAV
jgi:glycerophosphoryl diester phosphodiesterase